jgi:hypothetical protein
MLVQYWTNFFYSGSILLQLIYIGQLFFAVLGYIHASVISSRFFLPKRRLFHFCIERLIYIILYGLGLESQLVLGLGLNCFIRS